MKKKKEPERVYRFTSWSFSRYQDYVRCPAYACYKHLKKMRTVGSSQMTRGTEIHTRAEQFLDGTLKPMPLDLLKLRKQYAELRKRGARGELVQEQMWGHARDWTPIDPRAWDECWLRVKMDVIYLANKSGTTLHVDDHKSGQIKEDAHREQLSLYGVSALHRYSKVQVVVGRMLYVDKGKVIEEELKRKDLPSLTDKWEHKVAFMFADRNFAPRPGNYCRWCDFSKSKAGPCQF